MQSVREHWRALAIAVVLGVQILWALPVPSPVTDASRDRPAAQAEMARWALWTGMPEPAVWTTVIRVTGTLHQLHDVALAPSRPFMNALGLRQSWGMFARPDRLPHRLEVHLRVAEEWQPVFVRHDPHHRELSGPLRYRRVRALLDTDEPGAVWHNLTRWVAREILLAHPEGDAVRVRMVALAVGPPGEPALTPGPDVEVVHTRAVVLDPDGLSL